MLQTVLLKNILENANKIKDEFGSDVLCASHIAVAVADFCKTKYVGFSISDSTFHPSRFEEERLRYIFSKEVKLSSFFRIRLSKNIRDGVLEDEFDLNCCAEIASSRGAEALSSDIAFLCALKELPSSYHATLKSIDSDDSIIALLQDTDENIYNYVIQNIEELRCSLKAKADEAVSIRDWKPAEKFEEPDKLAALFFDSIEKQCSTKSITLKFPRFFGHSDLKLSIHTVGGIYYVHDNGCAIRHLSRKLNDRQKCQLIIKKVCDSCWIKQTKITGSFTTVFHFLYYLQRLVFIAHADLYYTKAEQPLYYKDLSFVYPDPSQAELLDVNRLFEELKKGISFDYDVNAGLYYYLDTKYSLFSTKASFLMETLENGLIRISDKRKGKLEGQIFEAFYWSNEDISLYRKFVEKIAERFRGEFDGKDIYLTVKQENFVNGIFKFFNFAVLLSEFGHDIAVPTLRQPSKKHE